MIKVFVTVDIKPLPDAVKRIENAVLGTGEELGGFNVWPVSQPRVTVDRKDGLVMSLRIRKKNPLAGTISPQEGSSEGVSYKLRREADSSDYWLDVTIGSLDAPGLKHVPITLKVSDGLIPELALGVRINALDHGLVVMPRTIDLGTVSLSALSSVVARIGIRRATSNIRVLSASSTLSFLRLEVQSIVEGNNYVVRVTAVPGATIKPGPFSGVVVVETDDPANQRIEVPLKVTFTK